VLIPFLLVLIIPSTVLLGESRLPRKKPWKNHYPQCQDHKVNFKHLVLDIGTPVLVLLNLFTVLGLCPPVEECQVGRPEVALTLIPVIVPRKQNVWKIKQTQKHPLVLRRKIPISTCQRQCEPDALPVRHGLRLVTFLVIVIFHL